MHDLVIHPRERELVVATHGRGIYVMDVAPLEELTPKVLAAKAHLFRIRPVKPRPVVPMTKPVGRTYAGQNPPDGAVIHYRLGVRAERATMEIVSPEGNVISRVGRGDDARAAPARVGSEGRHRGRRACR